MKYLAILFMGMILVSATCSNDNDKDCHNTITIVNNSDKDIYFSPSARYPDTLTLYPNPASAGDYYKVEKNTIGKDLYRDCIEYKFKAIPSGIIMFYIYDAQTIETVPWDTVVKKYLILKRYDLSLEDLQRMNWTITYP
jgi:hypothetical protein